MNVPNHVAIIMDGNGRWAEKRGLKRSMGHLEGSKTLEKLAIHAIDMGVSILSVYAFSTDNFKRSEEEVKYLMDLVVKYFNTKFEKINKKGVKVVISGRKENLRADVIEAIKNIEEKTKNNTKGILNICLNYGGQEEIIDGAIKLAKDIKNGLDIKSFKREDFYHYLYHELPPIDLLIRTGGEERVSNFMLYQMSYSEFYFTNTYFPDFDKSEFNKAIFMYENRDRRFGGLNKIVKFLDQHRIILVVLILIIVSTTFLGINSYLFLHHEFLPLTCTDGINEEYCYSKKNKILVEPEGSKETFFTEYQEEIEALKKKYRLDDFNFYTAYYYQVVSDLEYELTGENKELKDFFEVYANTYDLENYYLKNNLYFRWFYRYKIN